MSVKLKKPLLHTATEAEINAWLAKPSHGLLLSGRSGHNQNEVAKWAAEELAPKPLPLSGSGGSIKIDEIREAVKYAKQKNARDTISCMVVYNAETMTIEAQNAFLKILEEPPRGLIFILSCDDEAKLLKTIVSRLQSIEVRPLSKDMFFKAHTQSGQDIREVEKAWSLGRGSVTESRLSDETLEKAKLFASSDKYERLKQANDIIKDRSAAQDMVSALIPVYSYLLRQSISRGDNQEKISGMLEKLRILSEAQQQLAANANPKAVLTHLSISI